MKVNLKNEEIVGNYLHGLLKNRGIENIDAFLNPTKDLLQDPKDLENIEEGANLLLDTLNRGGKIWTVFDSDADGATSGAILYNYIHEIYPDAQIDWEIHSHKQHGLSDWIEELEDSDTYYDLVLIADAGSNDKEYWDRLGQLGTKGLCLDHHLVDNEISDNCILINNQVSPNYKNKDLSGAGVAWQFCRYLDEKLGKDLAWKYIDLAALGICSDMMKITSLENRYIFKEGFKNISNKFFIEIIKKQDYSMGSKVNPMTVAFYVTPLINAMIRSGTDEEKHRMYEAFLDGEKLVESHKRGANGAMEKLAVESVRECVNAKARQTRTLDAISEKIDIKIFNNNLLDNKILVIELDDEDDFPSEINGLVAMKCCANYKKPTLIGRTNNDGEIKGSFRGIADTELGSLKNYLDSTGMFLFTAGHDFAAGWGMKRSQLDNFIDKSNDDLKDIDFGEAVLDVDFIRGGNNCDDLGDIIFSLCGYEDIWGQGCEEGQICVRDIFLKRDDISIIGKSKDTVRFNLNGITFIKFKANDMIEELQHYNQISLTVVGKPNLNCWLGSYTPQIMIDKYEIVDEQFAF